MLTVAPRVQTSPAVEPVSVEYFGPDTPHLDGLVEKLAMAESLGRELAYRAPGLLEKRAWVGELAGMAGKAAPGLLNAGRAAAKTMMRSPGKALALGGAAAGAAAGGLSNPGYDAQGQQGSRIGGALRGAAVGAGLGFGASKIPGAGKMIQGQGKALSQNIRGTQWQNQGYAPLAPKLAGIGGLAKTVMGNPLARRAAMGGAVGAASGGEGHHMGGAVTGALLAGAAGAGGSIAQKAVKPAAATPFLAKASPRLAPLVAQGGSPQVAQGMRPRPMAPAAPDAPDGFGMSRTSKRAPVDPRAATAMAERPRTAVTRPDVAARGSMQALGALGR